MVTENIHSQRRAELGNCVRICSSVFRSRDILKINWIYGSWYQIFNFIIFPIAEKIGEYTDLRLDEFTKRPD
jgi:hypothetical protein